MGYGEARAWTRTALLGRRMPELHGLTFVPGIGQLWLQSWDPGYVELSVTDLSSQAELDELAAIQLPSLLARYQRIAQRHAFDELRPRIAALARGLAAASNQGWTRLGRTLGK